LFEVVAEAIFIYHILLWIVCVPGYSIDFFRAAKPS